MLLSPAKVTAATVSELLRENQLRAGKITPPPTKIRVYSFIGKGLESIMTFIDKCFKCFTSFLLIFVKKSL